MKQRPILFSTPMVQAIMDGRKTQTRRVVKPQPDEDGLARHIVRQWEDTSGRLYKCPYGKPGDVLWVRETWQPSANDVFVHFKADYKEEYAGKGWKPSIHMPKDAARIWLRIKSVRVERVEDISSEDCVREGIDKSVGDLAGRYMKYGVPDTAPFYARFPFLQPRDSFKSLWESINGEDSWSANPWVWVVEFERIERPDGE